MLGAAQAARAYVGGDEAENYPVVYLTTPWCGATDTSDGGLNVTNAL